MANQNNTVGWGQPWSCSQQGSAGLKLVGLVRANSWDRLSLTNEELEQALPGPSSPTPQLLPWTNHQETSMRPKMACASQQIGFRQQIPWLVSRPDVRRNRGGEQGASGNRGGEGWVPVRPQPARPRLPEEHGHPGRGRAWPEPRDKWRRRACLVSILKVLL